MVRVSTQTQSAQASSPPSKVTCAASLGHAEHSPRPQPTSARTQSSAALSPSSKAICAASLGHSEHSSASQRTSALTQSTSAPSPSSTATCAASFGFADHSSALQPSSDPDATRESLSDSHAKKFVRGDAVTQSSSDENAPDTKGPTWTTSQANAAGAGECLSMWQLYERLFAEVGAALSDSNFKEALQAFTPTPPIRAYYTGWRDRKCIPADAFLSQLESPLEELHAIDRVRGSNGADAVDDPSFEELVSALGFSQPFDGERLSMLSAVFRVAGAPSQTGTSAGASGSSSHSRESSVAEECPTQ